MNIKAIAFQLLALLCLASCGSSGGDGDGDKNNAVPDPVAATLIFPENNTECNEGNPISDEESIVTFQWNVSQNTDSYTVRLTNLNTGNFFETNATTNQASITILRGTPYAWSVISRATGTNATAQSDTWRFYNEGPGVLNFAPFPAEAVNPTRGSTLPAGTSSVELQWATIDLDADALEYELFFGVSGTGLDSLGFTAQTSQSVNVSAGIAYEWRVVTIDSFGNSSTSEIFQFRVAG